MAWLRPANEQGRPDAALAGGGRVDTGAGVVATGEQLGSGG